MQDRLKKGFSTVNNNASFSSATKFFDQRMEIIMFQKQDIIINHSDTEGERSAQTYITAYHHRT
jgi:hypothetical protein